jgi:hypothetical protein
MHCIVLLLVDLALIVFSTEFALLISSNLQFALDEFFEGLPYLGLTLASAVPVLVVTGLNRTLWRSLISRMAF